MHKEKNTYQKNKEWKKYREYRDNIISEIDIIHANSELTGNIYKKAFSQSVVESVNITHSGLKKEKHKRVDEVIHFAYMGGMNADKGFLTLKEACAILEDNKTLLPWDLYLYGGDYLSEYNRGRYYAIGYFNSSNEEKVWNMTDVLIVPSNWCETYGFVVAEALEKEIPVICSDVVGASYLERDIKPTLIFQHNNAKDLADKMKIFLAENLNKKEEETPIWKQQFPNANNYYDLIQKQISQIEIPDSMEKHYEEINLLYKEAQKKRKNYENNTCDNRKSGL